LETVRSKYKLVIGDEFYDLEFDFLGEAKVFKNRLEIPEPVKILDANGREILDLCEAQ